MLRAACVGTDADVGLVNTTQQPSVGGRDPEASQGYLALSDEELARMAVFYHAERRGWNK